MAEPAVRRVLVIGGTGVFGSRLVAGLLASTPFQVVAAGRGAERLAALVRQHGPRLCPCVLDTRCVTAGDLQATGAFVVVDAAGPYQGGSYAVAEAAIAAGLHYVDLADARDFVAGFAVLDAKARAAGVVALSGASSTPALSNAALDTLTAGWQRIDRVEIAISPGNRAPRGLSVMRAILSYAGRPVRVFAAGQWRERPGWGLTIRRTMPGLGRRWLSLAETPDLDIVPARFTVRQAAVFRAGLELSVLHLGLLAASLLVRCGVLHSLVPLARVFRAIAGAFEWFGTDQGGMTVQASGSDGSGQPVRATWSLVAEAGDGPAIPTLPALAAIRALADGRIARPGASACVGVLALAEIEAEFRPYRISSSIRCDSAPVPLYERVLGPAFPILPAPLQRLHRPGWSLLARGMARVEGADRPLARLAAILFRLPAAGDMPVQVEITPANGGERWVRDFGGHRFASRLNAASRPGHLLERFGPFVFELGLPVGAAGVSGMPVRRWWLGPMPLPRLFAPLSIATETVDDAGRFRFDVEMRLPFGLGRLVRYCGWLVVEGE